MLGERRLEEIDVIIQPPNKESDIAQPMPLGQKRPNLPRSRLDLGPPIGRFGHFNCSIGSLCHRV